MTGVETLLVITHIIGTVLGAGGALFAEIFYLKAIKDGVIDPTEGQFLKVTYFILRVGLVLLILSGFGLLIYYRLADQSELLYDEKLWAKLTIVLIILINAILLQIRKIPMWLGASLSLTSWYTALVLGSLRDIPYGYLSIMFMYAIAVVVMIFVLEGIKKMYLRKSV